MVHKIRDAGKVVELGETADAEDNTIKVAVNSVCQVDIGREEGSPPAAAKTGNPIKLRKTNKYFIPFPVGSWFSENFDNLCE
jgi:hypothetical protein